MLTAEIFKHTMFAGCSAGGLSERNDRVTIVNVAGPIDRPVEGAPPVLLETHLPGCLRLIPAYFNVRLQRWEAAPGRNMAGGAFVATSDSRFRAACEQRLGHRFYGAVALHDRCEVERERPHVPDPEGLWRPVSEGETPPDCV